MKVHARKSYAWINDKETDQPFTAQNQPFEILGGQKCYKYLGVHINLKLDWSNQIVTTMKEHKQAIDELCRKCYLPGTIMIKLINQVITPRIEYKMNHIRFPDKVIKELEDYTITKLNNTFRYPNISGNIWFNVRGLRKLSTMQTAATFSTMINLLTNQQI